MEIKDFHAMSISLASPEEIRSWSHGEVTKPETINYRRLRPEKDGLFCEAIFGPTKDWQCYCGKFKKIRYRGIICDKCGVEVTRSRVRRERMGHIELASPVAHIWYTRRVPSYLGILLDISRRNLDRVLYFAQYIVTRVDEEERQRVLKRIDEECRSKVQELRGRLQAEVETLRADADRKLEAAREEAAGPRAAANARLEEQTSELMRAAADVQARLSRKRKGAITKDIIFAPTGTRIAAAGEQITQEHHRKLNEILEARLSELQAEAEEATREHDERLAALQATLHQTLDEQVRAHELRTESEIAALEDEYRHRRDDVLSIQPLQLLTEAEYWDLKEHWGAVFDAGMGAEALYDIVSHMDMDALATELRNEIVHGRSKQRRKKAAKRLKVVQALRRSGNRPEWMILKVLPVIPPDLRPMVQLDGGRFATSDLNDLYRRVINRNNRLKRLIELGAPDVIIRNEKRMLQEAVDSLIDNSRRGKAVSARGRRKLKSLSDMLKGKQGRFRRNLLGKRVDYSGRSVIVIGPHLKLHQCGLPKAMALELFRPFVMERLVKHNHTHNVKGAKRMIEQVDPRVWVVLEEIIADYPVLLNRAPTLHRLGIQAFQPVLVEGNAIQIHPLVCAAFNADFDGDMMAVHVPLSEKAKREARELMLANKNLLKPASGEPIVEPVKDMVLGMYYMTMERPGATGSGKAFASLEEVQLAYELGHVALHAPIDLLTETHYADGSLRPVNGHPERRLLRTTVGRALFNLALPAELRYYDPGVPLDKNRVKELVAHAYETMGPERTAELVDRIKDVGFAYATRSGLSIAVDDIVVPATKRDIIANADEIVTELNRQFRRGLITDEERYYRTIEVWQRATDELTDAVRASLPEFGSIRTMASSGASKGGFTPIRQLAGMRGLMGDPSGRIIDLPIRSNFREGLSTLEYFISTHGARKGLADTALRTADAGYLTRRLVDVAQECVINDRDCGTTNGLTIRARRDGVLNDSLAERLIGRVTLEPVVHPATGEVLADANQLIDAALARQIEDAGLTEVRIRSPLGCKMRHGLCQLCYGQDLARGGLVNIGEAVGIIAAQSIGEPGTQLTLRTFHTGGVATGGGGDITQGLPRVQELFEARVPKGESILSDLAGRVSLHREGEVTMLRVTDVRPLADEYPLPPKASLAVRDGDQVQAGQTLFRHADGEVVAEHEGVVAIEKKLLVVRREERLEESYILPVGARLKVREGDLVEAGQQLTEGSQNPHRIISILGVEATQTYLLDEIQRVYRSQGVAIADKHIETIIRQMLGKVRILRPYHTKLLPGDLVDRAAIDQLNAAVTAAGGRGATYQQVLLGITKASLETDSLLAAASFQHTITVLAKAAIEGKTDRLVGLKENVILGKLIPAGTGFRPRPDLGHEEEPLEGEGLLMELTDEVVAELAEEGADFETLAMVDEEAVATPLGIEPGEEEALDEEEAAEESGTDGEVGIDLEADDVDLAEDEELDVLEDDPDEPATFLDDEDLDGFAQGEIATD